MSYPGTTEAEEHLPETMRTCPVEVDFQEVAYTLRYHGMDCFRSILYKGQEVPHLPIIKDLFTLVDYLIEGGPEDSTKSLSDLKWTPHPERWREVYPSLDPEELQDERGRECLSGIGMFTHAVNESSTNFCSLGDQASLGLEKRYRLQLRHVRESMDQTVCIQRSSIAQDPRL